jgi:hypothetical protein
MKVIFLDIDGVVNNADSAGRYTYRGIIGIDPNLAFLVGKLVMETDAKVVLSSSWRHSPHGVEEVERQVCKLLDMTVTLGRPAGIGIEYCERGREIKEWLDRHPEVERYAILDDENDMLPEQQPHFFKTTWLHGVTPEICERVKEHLLK